MQPEGRFTDFQIIAEERPIKVHRCVLCQNPYFGRLFESSFKETKEQCLRKESVKYGVVLEAIKFIYNPDKTVELTDDKDIISLLELNNEWLMNDNIQCNVIGKLTGVENLISVLELCQGWFSQEKLQRRVIARLREISANFCQNAFELYELYDFVRPYIFSFVTKEDLFAEIIRVAAEEPKTIHKDARDRLSNQFNEWYRELWDENHESLILARDLCPDDMLVHKPLVTTLICNTSCTINGAGVIINDDVKVVYDKYRSSLTLNAPSNSYISGGSTVHIGGSSYTSSSSSSSVSIGGSSTYNNVNVTNGVVYINGVRQGAPASTSTPSNPKPMSHSYRFKLSSITTSGVGDIQFDCDCVDNKNFRVATSGTAFIFGKGTLRNVDNISIRSSGTSKIVLDLSAVKRLDIDASGMGSVTVNKGASCKYTKSMTGMAKIKVY